MPISSQENRWSFLGDGATTTWFYTNKIFAASDLKVFLDGVLQVGGYGVTGVGLPTGGAVTFNKPPGRNVQIVVLREVPVDQQVDFIFGGKFPSQNAEDGLDKATVLLQQNLDRIKRSVRLSDSDPTRDFGVLPPLAQNLGRYLAIGGDGQVALVAGTAEAADLSTKTVLPTGAGTARTIADLFGLGALMAENVKLYGAKGDTAELADGSVTDGSAVLSSGSVAFDSDDVGKIVAVEGAATAGVAITGAAAAPIDAAWQYDSVNDSFADFTAALNSDTAGDVEPFPAVEAVGDVFYIGHAEPFTGVRIDIGTAGVGGTVVWEYWDGSAWQTLTVTDGTVGFTAAPGNHDLTFTPPGDWATTQINTAVNGEKLYYIRARLTTVYTTNPILDDATLQGGRIRITATAHGFNPGQVVTVKGIVGTTEANGTFETVRAGLNAFDLKGSSFANAYVSGGTAHGWLFSTIQSVSGGDATLAANAGASIAGTARFLYGTDDTAAIQAAIDSGKTVVVPDGAYLTGPLKVVTEGQKIIGRGGRLLANPTADIGPRNVLLRLVADFTAAIGLYLDNPTEQMTDDGPDVAINRGISIEANKVRVEGNIVRRFLGGIAVTDRPGDTFEFGGEVELHGNVITGNIVWENLGAGSGDDQDGGIGEDRGDGIVSWGAATVITSNVVHVKEGYDARIAIHVEALGLSHDKSYPYSDRGATIIGNMVLGNGIEGRNGRWRRGIFNEGVWQATISGNFVSSCRWWGIGTSFGISRGGNVTIADNQVLWDRPQKDVSGDNFAVNEAAIAVWGVSSGGAIQNVAVTGNNVDISGTVNQAILVSSFDTTADQGLVRIIGNGARQRGGLVFNGYIRAALDSEELVIANNTLRGAMIDTAGAMIKVQGARTHAVVSDNIAENEGVVGNGVRVEGGPANIVGNSLRGGNDGIQLFNSTAGATVSGNLIRDVNSDGIDVFASDNVSMTGNVFRTVGALYTRNFTPSATMIDANNVKS